MQKTREQIVNILKVRGHCTVEELSQELGLTPVTVRHHLEILRSGGLVAPPQPLRRPGPGRPQHVYHLSDQASELFPKNYDLLASECLRELATTLSSTELEGAIERIAGRIAGRAAIPEDAELPTRLERTLQFLNAQGYLASLEEDEDGRLLLHIANCPYERVARELPEPCRMEEYMLFLLLGRNLKRTENISGGDERCTYVIPTEEA